MNFQKIKAHQISFRLFVLLFCISLLSSCGDGNRTSDKPLTDTGDLSFRVAYHDNGVNSQLQTAVIDCAGQGVDTVEADVYDADIGFLVGGGPWNCEAGQGSITAVSAGSGRTVVVLGFDSNGYAVFRGQKSGINVIAASNNNAGTIDCYAFYPSLQAPANGAVVNADTMGFAWHAVAGAAQYQIVVSENSDLAEPIIDELTTLANYSPTGLSDDETYYWQVWSDDIEGNKSVGSEIWSFSVDADHVNTPPAAEITSPDQGSTYITIEAVVFAGSGNDTEDGALTGASLVWTSNLDGQIGTGATFNSDTLSAGTHQITLTVTDTDGETGTDQVTITISFPAGSLPDTGQTLSYTDTFGEDSDYTGNPPKYTKLDSSGNVLDASASTWAMVRDDVTGLIWENKTDDGGMSDRNKTYTWMAVQSNFIALLNSANFGGYSDWRLPTIKELYAIVHKDKVEPQINTDYFPNTVASEYWSDTTVIGVTDPRFPEGFAWLTNFIFGSIYGKAKSTTGYARAVRGGQTHSTLANNGDGTVTDTNTGLMWQQATAGPMTWEEALVYCESLVLAGHNDWRLPNANALHSIVDYEVYEPSINNTIFPGTLFLYNYWSSTSNYNDAQTARDVVFSHGYVNSKTKTKINYVRAVRGRQ